MTRDAFTTELLTRDAFTDLVESLGGTVTYGRRVDSGRTHPHVRVDLAGHVFETTAPTYRQAVARLLPRVEGLHR